MTQLVASAADLPLPDRSFDIVLASDVLEHIPPSLRVQVISETLRVADKLVVFGFPCGKEAHDSDRALRQEYLDKSLPVPVWLEEHMEADFPEPSLFSNLPGWKVEQFSNESLSFHQWMMRREMNRLFVRVTGKFTRVFPGISELALRNMDGNPSYRQIFVLTRS
jgi:ubiquinone/menaquinone biosynthesis C-methylase UbiE